MLSAYENKLKLKLFVMFYTRILFNLFESDKEKLKKHPHETYVKLINNSAGAYLQSGSK